MNTIQDKDLLKLFRSGKFTIVTYDRFSYTVYPSRFVEADDDKDDMESFSVDGEDGYLPRIVALLAEALGGSTDSI